MCFGSSAQMSLNTSASACLMPLLPLLPSCVFWSAICSFCGAERLGSRVSFVCSRMPKISPGCGA
eukprot:6860483-Heterocapsa_arctica.AAC.1